MSPRVLLVSYYFPPSVQSSGHLRTLGFARYLPEFGWEPVVLSAHVRAYSKIDRNSVSQIPPRCAVYRAFALDARKHLGVRGKYPSVLAQPDRWASWWLGAVPVGLRLIKRYDIRAIWSTYPIMTSHWIAHTLHRLTGLPWIADFRDPVTTADVGQSRLTAVVRAHLEKRVVLHADRAVFTTPGAAALYSERYPSAAKENRISIIPNGFDEGAFVNLPKYSPHDGPLQLVHSGALYTEGRNPTAFLEALAELRRKSFLADSDLHVTLRASGNDADYARLIEYCGVGDMVTLAPAIPHEDALAELAQADGLLVFQGKQFNRQIPAKVYEYVRIGRPVFAIIDSQGDTASLLSSMSDATSAPIDDPYTIGKALMRFLEGIRERRSFQVDHREIVQYSRSAAAETLGNLLSGMTERWG